MKIFFSLLVIATFSCRPPKQREKLPDQSLKTTAIKAKRILDSSSIIHELQFLASDTCEGRKPGSAGHEKAAQRIINDFRSAGIDTFNTGLVQLFSGRSLSGFTEGKNIIATVKGTKYADSFIIITAHYDHLGKTVLGKIFYGADDNASGAACLVSLAKYFAKNRTPFSLIFVSFDREETGLEGSNYFVDHLPKGVNQSNIKLNLNLDMLARADSNIIYACGLKHYPALAYAIDSVKNETSVKLIAGHDSGSFMDDWTTQSDHYPFHKAHIPFLYIGVENHEDYHQPTDKADKINYSTYIEICNMVAALVNALQQ